MFVAKQIISHFAVFFNTVSTAPQQTKKGCPMPIYKNFATLYPTMNYFLVFWKFQWRDVILWYLFIVYLVYSAYQLWQPVRARGVAKQIFWRSLGGLTAAGFAVMLLLKPRSGLSEALMLLGGFLICWGTFQLLLPAPRE